MNSKNCFVYENEKSINSNIITSKFFLNQKGQGLIEYLIIVALVAVGSLAVMRVISSQINYQYAKINQALGGNSVQRPSGQEVTSSMLNKKDLSNFMNGSRQRDTSSGSSSNEESSGN